MKTLFYLGSFCLVALTMAMACLQAEAGPKKVVYSGDAKAVGGYNSGFKSGAVANSAAVSPAIGPIFGSTLSDVARSLARPSPTRAITLKLSPVWIAPRRRRV